MLGGIPEPHFCLEQSSHQFGFHLPVKSIITHALLLLLLLARGHSQSWEHFHYYFAVYLSSSNIYYEWLLLFSVFPHIVLVFYTKLSDTVGKLDNPGLKIADNPVKKITAVSLSQ